MRWPRQRTGPRSRSRWSGRQRPGRDTPPYSAAGPPIHRFAPEEYVPIRSRLLRLRRALGRQRQARRDTTSRRLCKSENNRRLPMVIARLTNCPKLSALANASGGRPVWTWPGPERNTWLGQKVRPERAPARFEATDRLRKRYLRAVTGSSS
jgi:hypothetical protein